MALPTYQAHGSQAASSSADIAPAWPTHAVDDIGFLVVEETGDATSPATPSGWAHVTGSPLKSGGVPGAGDTRINVWWKRATSTSESAPTVPFGGALNHLVGRIHTVRGCIASGNPWDITGTSVAATTDTNVSVPGGTTTVADCLILLIASRSSDIGTTAEFSGWTNSDLANLTEQVETGTALANGGGFAVVTGEKATAGTFAATTATLANTATQARIMIALKPPVAAGGDLLLRMMGENLYVGMAA